MLGWGGEERGKKGGKKLKYIVAPSNPCVMTKWCEGQIPPFNFLGMETLICDMIKVNELDVRNMILNYRLKEVINSYVLHSFEVKELFISREPDV